MLWSGKAIADVPFLCYRIERVEYFTQNDKDVVMFAFQGFSLGIQLSEIQQLVNQFQQIVGILFDYIQNAFTIFGMVYEKNSSSGLMISDKGVRSS